MTDHPRFQRIAAERCRSERAGYSEGAGHIWSQGRGGRPVRCVLCGRYLQPWWARLQQRWWKWRYR